MREHQSIQIIIMCVIVLWEVVERKHILNIVQLSVHLKHFKQSPKFTPRESWPSVIVYYIHDVVTMITEVTKDVSEQYIYYINIYNILYICTIYIM